jgi:hypothetical protein
MGHHDKSGHSHTTKIYYPVTCQKRVGAVIATTECVAFHDDESNGEKILELDWQRVTKITANVASSPTSLLRLTTHTQQTVFQFDTRADLVLAKMELKALWKAVHDVSMRNYDDEDFSESKRDAEEDLKLAVTGSRSHSGEPLSQHPIQLLPRKSSSRRTISVGFFQF